MIMHRSDALPCPHGFFGRDGGESPDPWRSLNMSWRSGDHRERVLRNRSRAASALGFEAPILARQVHGATCLIVDGPLPLDDPPEADALATRTVGLCLGVLTADCAPVLLADPETGVVAAAHAGWRGAVAGVIDATIDAMTRLGAEPRRVRAAIGPCIAQESYEVGPEFDGLVDARFLRRADGAARARFDLPGYVEHGLRAAGVTTVDRLALDTFADQAGFFSWRRATLRGERVIGLQLSAIGLPQAG